MSSNSSSKTVLVVAATVVVVATIGAITAVAIAIEDGARASSMIALISTPLTVLIGFLGLFVRVESIKNDVGQVKQQTTELTNGLGDAKARHAAATVLRPDLIDPDPAVAEQLERDRARVAEAATRAGEAH